ncbi:AAA family ATPase [Actinotignum timonense]|uniref:AAA family ATPase n=1 Tax=Actinotignum timonense TaxID=1870995 RepID=UPI0025514BB2|nr:ATP-binding protein [Actinotignum timonense]MDK6628716.1 ATP-binding protein [Actinotignum timonense]
MSENAQNAYLFCICMYFDIRMVGMILLGVGGANFRSLRDEWELSLLRPSLRHNIPPKGESWREHVWPCAAIYGANASGKSTVLEALNFIRDAVYNSARSWASADELPVPPFALDPEKRNADTTLWIDFVTDGIRYVYSFTLNERVIVREELLAYYSTRATTLIDRDARGHKVHPTRVGKINEVSPRELVLSRAAVLDAKVLGDLARIIGRELLMYRVGNSDYDLQVHKLTSDLSKNIAKRRLYASLAKVADVGIDDISVESREFPPELLDMFKKLIPEEHQDEEITAELVKQFALALRFSHKGAKDSITFAAEQESLGTTSWLALGSLAVEALRTGKVVCVDEIDASLHPMLATELIAAFQDPELNANGGQIIFTSHNPYFLSHESGTDLMPGQVWLTEKNNDGATDLFSVADFPDVKPGTDMASLYMSGRLGATPLLEPWLFRKMIGGHSDG